MYKKSVEEARSCLECEQLVEDGKILRCSMYNLARIENPDEKHCKDSIN